MATADNERIVENVKAAVNALIDAGYRAAWVANSHFDAQEGAARKRTVECWVGNGEVVLLAHGNNWFDVFFPGTHDNRMNTLLAAIADRPRLARERSKPRYYECGICGDYHPADWDGDCREDVARFTANDLDRKHGALGWTEVDMP